MSELPGGVPRAEPPRPRDSASAIVLRRGTDGALELLLGVRSRRSRFMPGFLAFPGGALEAQDEPERAGAFARCAAREMREETGLDLRAEVWHPAGERTTPPMFPVRFRTEFFVAAPGGGVDVPAPPSEEIESLAFERPDAVIERWHAGRVRVPPPTLAILRGLGDGADPGDPAGVARRIAEANEREERTPRIEFVPGTWVVPLRTETLPPASHTNAWIVGGQRFVIVDPGTADAGELARLRGVVERRRLETGGEPFAVLLTHHHRDHMTGAAPLARELGLPILAHPLVLHVVVGQDEVGAATRPVGDRDRIDLAGETLIAHHTPGHAPGHLAFELEGRGVVLCGDLASALSTILIHPHDGDMESYLDSLARLRDLRCATLLPGHGPPLPGRAIDGLIEHRFERERRVLEAVSGPRTPLEAIARAAYADVPAVPVGLSSLQALSHLERLRRQGRIHADDPAGSHWSPA